MALVKIRGEVPDSFLLMRQHCIYSFTFKSTEHFLPRVRFEPWTLWLLMCLLTIVPPVCALQLFNWTCFNWLILLVQRALTAFLRITHCDRRGIRKMNMFAKQYKSCKFFISVLYPDVSSWCMWSSNSRTLLYPSDYLVLLTPCFAFEFVSFFSSDSYSRIFLICVFPAGIFFSSCDWFRWCKCRTELRLVFVCFVRRANTKDRRTRVLTFILQMVIK